MNFFVLKNCKLYILKDENKIKVFMNFFLYKNIFDMVVYFICFCKLFEFLGYNGKYIEWSIYGFGKNFYFYILYLYKCNFCLLKFFFKENLRLLYLEGI